MELGAVLEAVEGRGGGGPEAVERVLARYNEEVTGRWGGRASRLVSLSPPPPPRRCRRPVPPSAAPPAPGRGGPGLAGVLAAAPRPGLGSAVGPQRSPLPFPQLAACARYGLGASPCGTGVASEGSAQGKADSPGSTKPTVSPVEQARCQAPSSTPPPSLLSCLCLTPPAG